MTQQTHPGIDKAEACDRCGSVIRAIWLVAVAERTVCSACVNDEREDDAEARLEAFYAALLGSVA